MYEGSTRSEDAALLRDAVATTELRDRLSRLEILMEGMAALNFRDSTGAQRVGVAMDPPMPGILTAPRTEADDPVQLLGRAIFDARSSVYVDSSAWSELFERVKSPPVSLLSFEKYLLIFF